METVLSAFIIGKLKKEGLFIMKNTKVLEMLNSGQIEELKALLQDEIFTESLKGNGNAKKRYSAMKKYFTLAKAYNASCEKPCVIDFEGQKHTSFVNGYSIALTTETAGQMEHFEDVSNYLNVAKMVTYDGTKREIDFTRVLAEAKSKGYKLKKSEVDKGDNFQYIMHYDGAYFKIGLLDATYSIIDNGEKAEVYHQDGKKTSPIVIKNDIGVAVVLPVNYNAEDFQNDGKVVIEVEVA